MLSLSSWQMQLFLSPGLGQLGQAHGLSLGTGDLSSEVLKMALDKHLRTLCGPAWTNRLSLPAVRPSGAGPAPSLLRQIFAMLSHYLTSCHLRALHRRVAVHHRGGTACTCRRSMCCSGTEDTQVWVVQKPRVIE